MRRGAVRLCIIVLLNALFLFYFLKCDRNSALQDVQKQYENAVATAEYWRDKDSLHHARIIAIETERTKDFLKLKVQDSLIQRLQKAVLKNRKEIKHGGQIVITESETAIRKAIKTESDIAVITDSNSCARMVFTDSLWYRAEVTIRADSSRLDLTTRNRYVVTVGCERQLFGNSRYFAEVHNDNPYSEVKGIRTYRVQMPPGKRFGIGIQVGYGINSKLQLNPYVGIGISWNVIQF